MKRMILCPLAAVGLVIMTVSPLHAQKLVENLGRGIVAVPAGENQVHVGWRLLGTDPPAVGFNLYRATGAGQPLKLNSEPLTLTTDFLDAAADLTQDNTYFVRPVLEGVELQASAPFTLPANPPAGQ